MLMPSKCFIVYAFHFTSYSINLRLEVEVAVEVEDAMNIRS